MRVEIDENAYSNMLEAMNTLVSTDISGTSSDICFINDDFWLQDTAVIENIEYRKGQYMIFLVFAHHLKPLKFLKRKIVQYACPKKAAIVAHYMRRQAAKDQRGTLTVNLKMINIAYS
ncbi:MAG: hypothetical protein KF862_19105 [Chitinophagaceae bacterium]|nr:hypothetical protein [Chitinophagaceae bacterium]